jgi:hypothetical protein
MAKDKDMEYKNGQMGAIIKENGKMIKQTVKGNFIMPMDLYTKEP